MYKIGNTRPSLQFQLIEGMTSPNNKKKQKQAHAIQTVCFGCLITRFPWTWRTTGGCERCKRLHRVKVWTAASVSAGEDERSTMASGQRRAKLKRLRVLSGFCEQPEPLNSSSLSRIHSRHVWQSVACVSPSDLSVSAYVLCIFFFPPLFLFLQVNIFCVRLGAKKKRICSYQGKSSQGSPTSQSYHVWLMSRSQEPQPPAPHRCSLGVGTGSLTEQKGDLFVARLQRRNGTLCFSSITYIDTHGREMNREMRQKFWESRRSCGI